MPIEVVSGAAAVANVASECFFLMLYGPPGTQKTTDAVQAFARPDGSNGAFFIPCEDGALKPILARGLAVPDHPREVVRTWEGMCEAVAFAAANRNRYSAVIIDTLSTWTANVYKHLEDTHKGNRNKFAIPLQMRQYLYQMRIGARNLGLHVVMIAHAQPPMYDPETGAFKSHGGPLLAPRTAIDLFYGEVDSVLRVDSLPVLGGRQRVYFTGGEEWPPGIVPADAHLWRAKNREGCGLAVVPADLGAFVRARKPPYSGL